MVNYKISLSHEDFISILHFLRECESKSLSKTCVIDMILNNTQAFLNVDDCPTL